MHAQQRSGIIALPLQEQKVHREPLLKEIKAAICELYGYTPEELENSRLNKIAMARQIFCYLAAVYTDWSLKEIGRRVNVTHHTTVMHAIRKVKAGAGSQPLLADDLDLLRLKIAEKVMMRVRRRMI
jgi:chromosomal replication initiation ATPase DnaA